MCNLRIIESVESKYEVQPLEGYTFEKILHLLQRNEAQVLHGDDQTKGVYIPTPRQQPGVKKIAAMKPCKGQTKIVTYGCD